MKTAFLRSALLLAGGAARRLRRPAADQGSRRPAASTSPASTSASRSRAAQIAIEPFDHGRRQQPRISQLCRRGGARAEPARLDGRAGNAQSEQVALVDLEQGSREAMRRAPVSVGVGGGTAAVGGGVGAASARPPVGSVHQIVTDCSKSRIKRRSDGTVAWEGRAVDEAARPAAREPLGRRPSTGLPRRCFGTSPGSRAALSGFDDPIRFERLRRRQHSPGRHRGRPHRPRDRQGPPVRFLPMVLLPADRRAPGGRSSCGSSTAPAPPIRTAGRTTAPACPTTARNGSGSTPTMRTAS